MLLGEEVITDELSAVVSIIAYTWCTVYAGVSLKSCAWAWIGGAREMQVLGFTSWCQVILQSNYARWHSRQQCVRVFSDTHPL